MKTTNPGLNAFLEENLAGYPLDFDAFVAAFQGEMAEGLAGRPSSLSMFPSHIEPGSGRLPLNQPVAVIDAGGTNLRTALVSLKSDYTLAMSDFDRHPMPGIDRKVSAGEFFSTIAGYVRKTADKTDRIGFCFSYPMSQDSSSDGILQSWTKEIKAPEVLNRPICAHLKAALKEQGCREEKRMTILNDTVATLLAGRTHDPLRSYGGFVGLIMGTGLNAAYWETNDKIGKLPGAPAGGSQAVNMESAGFRKGPRGPLDEAFFQTTESPLVNQLEKMSSGAYLGPLLGFYLRAAAERGLFSQKTAGQILEMPGLETWHLDQFLRNPSGAHLLGDLFRGAGAGELEVCWRIADALLERASMFVAGVLSSIILWTGEGTDPLRPVCICADGSTFYKLQGYRFRTEYHLRKYLQEGHGRYFEIVSVENAPVVGAAVAGLTN